MDGKNRTKPILLSNLIARRERTDDAQQYQRVLTNEVVGGTGRRDVHFGDVNNVHFGPGVHSVGGGLLLGEANSGVVVSGEGPGITVLTGGTALPPWLAMRRRGGRSGPHRSPLPRTPTARPSCTRSSSCRRAGVGVGANRSNSASGVGSRLALP